MTAAGGDALKGWSANYGELTWMVSRDVPADAKAVSAALRDVADYCEAEDLLLHSVYVGLGGDHGGLLVQAVLTRDPAGGAS